MTAKPWMPLYVADYLADTAHLDAAQSGAYLLLIMHYWQTGGLPKNDAALMRIARMTHPQWKRERETLAAFFGDDWTHKRIAAELAHAADVSSKRRASANLKHSNSSAIAEQKHTHAGASSQSQSQSQLTDTPPTEATPTVDEPDAAVEAYNAACPHTGWPSVQRLTPSRRTALKARLRESGGMAGWLAAIDKAKASTFLCGYNERAWKLDFDWLCKAANFTKIMEGNYDRSAASPTTARNGKSRPHDALFRAVAEQFASGTGSGEWQADPDVGLQPEPEATPANSGPVVDLEAADFVRSH